ncbi:MAG: HAD family phosphatase [Deltaproteobacteria bacterium]|nr:HAD family phosphatase [Deltaproteobacteria bacterium]
MPAEQITTLFLDIGGVLLTNGWGRDSRRLAADKFGLDYEEMDERHHLTFDTYEEGKLSLDEYLERVVFYEPRAFSLQEFREFMYAESRLLPDMLDFMLGLKKRHGFRVVAVSNEGRELTQHRIQAFELNRLFDFYVSSCFVHYRKPDLDIYRLALDGAQCAPSRAVYLDDRAMFVEVARKLGIHGIHHHGLENTRARLAELGLAL